jgi:hypothetical protein
MGLLGCNVVCSSVEAPWCVGGTCRLYVQGRRVNQAKNQQQAEGKHSRRGRHSLRNFGEFLSNFRRYNWRERDLHSYRSENICLYVYHLLTSARSEKNYKRPPYVQFTNNRIYDIYSKDSLHNNTSERTTKYTLMCQHFVLIVAHATCFDTCFGSSSGGCWIQSFVN